MHVDAVIDLALSPVAVIMYVSHTCAAHSDPRFMSSEIGSCAALAVGDGLIRFGRMIMLRVRCTSRLVRMLVFVHLIYMYALTIHA